MVNFVEFLNFVDGVSSNGRPRGQIPIARPEKRDTKRSSREVVVFSGKNSFCTLLYRCRRTSLTVYISRKTAILFVLYCMPGADDMAKKSAYFYYTKYTPQNRRYCFLFRREDITIDVPKAYNEENSVPLYGESSLRTRS